MSEILFINPISVEISLFIIKNGICKEKYTLTQWDDFSQFPEKVIELLYKYNIKEIWCICGPGWFTRMRIITLTLNTLILSRWLDVKWCHFFHLIKKNIPIMRANDQEYIIRSLSWEDSLVKKALIPLGVYIWYGEKNDFTDERVLIEYREDFSEITRIFASIPVIDTLTPIYLKDPHITLWSKKNTSPF